MTETEKTTPATPEENLPNTPASCGSCAGGRRLFLKAALSFLVLAWGSVAAYPFYQYLNPPASEDEADQISTISLGSPDGIPPESAKNFKFGSKPAIIYRDAEGEFHAYSAVCTHLGCTVQYKEQKKNIICACHGGIYEAATGKNIAGPPPKPLPKFNVSVENNDVIVSRV